MFFFLISLITLFSFFYLLVSTIHPTEGKTGTKSNWIRILISQNFLCNSGWVDIIVDILKTTYKMYSINIRTDKILFPRINGLSWIFSALPGSSKTVLKMVLYIALPIVAVLVFLAVLFVVCFCRWVKII